jgi:hypothetical protein
MRTNLAKIFSLAIASTLVFSSCEKDTETVNNPVYNIRGNANGAQETPNRINTTATGTITGTYNKENNKLDYTITWTGLTGGNPSAMHFHGPADPGVGAGIRLPITGFPATTSGTVTKSETLTDDQENELISGLWYYNIHNTTYPAGEIRGQIFLTQ